MPLENKVFLFLFVWFLTLPLDTYNGYNTYFFINLLHSISLFIGEWDYSKIKHKQKKAINFSISYPVITPICILHLLRKMQSQTIFYPFNLSVCLTSFGIGWIVPAENTDLHHIWIVSNQLLKLCCIFHLWNWNAHPVFLQSRCKPHVPFRQNCLFLSKLSPPSYSNSKN